MDKVCVVGLGYIGLPTASLLANRGYRVRGVDVNARVVETINRGEIHIHEPDLDVMVRSAVNSGLLTASQTPAPADVFILAVPTPFKEEHVPDISYVEAATQAVAPYLEPGNLVILESTSPVGTTEKIASQLKKLRPNIDEGSPIYIAHCPERVLPGQILKELISNDRIVGGIDPASTKKAAAFYKKFVTGEVLGTDARTAEMAKLTENAFRDVNIAFANELSLICDRLNIDVWKLIELANRHPRVKILKPGPGVGGHCIAVDPWFIVDSAPDQARLMRMAREVNDSKPEYVFDKVKAAAAEYNQPIIACLGLAYKANIDDLRESPAVAIVRKLAVEGVGNVWAVEPHIKSLPASLEDLGNIQMVDVEAAVKKADIVVLLVDHFDFTNIDRELLRGKIVFDTRGIWR
ncbi:MAG: UDP-N-acetyl-D-mannosamine dehydrogenase [Oscillatoria princeps RMCB-10]|jgi:UDP-N-acetyl-D-mannosaminuronic acid dehydrogenase|nr:UDP-N-acetyl-D-mannosamine dehydrogenase [Oscillatoria princeps RMCB-10]